VYDAPGQVMPSADPQPYHRLLRNPSYSWWRMVLYSFLILVGWILATAVLVVPVMAVNGDGPDEVSWSTLLATNLSLASLIVLSILVARYLNRQPPGYLSSVRPGLRWRPLWIFVGVALAAEFALLTVGALLPMELADEVSGPASDAALLITVTLLTSGLQAAGEEYFFRGYLMQAFGAMVRNPIFAVLLTSLLFTMAHGVWPWESPALFADRFAFGVVAGWLVLRTGGLEAAIAIHAVNNIVTFIFAALTDSVSDSLGITDAPWSVVALDIAKFILFALVAIRIADRRKMERSAPVPYIQPPPPPLWPGQQWPGQQWPGQPVQPPGQQWPNVPWSNHPPAPPPQQWGPPPAPPSAPPVPPGPPERRPD
jgi:uncharacterized protein